MEIRRGMHRVFIGVEFSDDAIKEIARVQEVLGNWKFDGKMTELENVHLTLKFLGEISFERLKRVKEKLREIEFEKMELGLGNVGCFSHLGMPRIIWVKVLGKGVYELQEKIDNALEEIGFNKEERFMGHATIARVKYVKDKKGFKNYIDSLKIKENIKFETDRFKLIESELRSLGPVYRTLGTYKSR